LRNWSYVWVSKICKSGHTEQCCYKQCTKMETKESEAYPPPLGNKWINQITQR
jgi:hypothetical protein